MRAQRPASAAVCVAATAESLPFEDKRFDAAMAFATVHHWQDPIAGMREMQTRGSSGGGIHLRHQRSGLAPPILADS